MIEEVREELAGGTQEKCNLENGDRIHGIYLKIDNHTFLIRNSTISKIEHPGQSNHVFLSRDNGGCPLSNLCQTAENENMFPMFKESSACVRIFSASDFLKGSKVCRAWPQTEYRARVASGRGPRPAASLDMNDNGNHIPKYQHTVL